MKWSSVDASPDETSQSDLEPSGNFGIQIQDPNSNAAANSFPHTTWTNQPTAVHLDGEHVARRQKSFCCRDRN